MLDLPAHVVFGQLMLGLINGSFYALMSLGLAIIVGLLGVINFAHGAFYMMGAFTSWMLYQYAGIGYWPALICVPILVGFFGVLVEVTLLRRLYDVDPVYGLLLTFGLVLVIESFFRLLYGVAGLPYPIPASLSGAVNLGFMYLPIYRAWVLSISLTLCIVIIILIDHTRLGAYLRAATENRNLVQNFGINISLISMLTFGLGVGLAGFAGALAAPIYQVSPLMGTQLVVVAFAVVVIGGMGSIAGAVITGLLVGLIEGISKLIYPEGSGLAVFLVMALVLVVRPVGLFGRART